MTKTILSVLLSNFTGAGIGFLLNIILARILSVEEYGRINLVLTIIIVVFTVFEFGFNNSVVVFYNKFKDKHLNIEYFINQLYAKYVILITLPILLIVYILSFIYNFTTLECSIIVINIFIFSIYRYILSIYQAKAQWKTYNILNILNNIIKLTLLLSFLLIFTYMFGYKNNYNIVLFAYIVSSIILFVILLFKIPSKKLITGNNKRIISDFKKIIIPIGISNIFIIVSMRADIFFIEHYLGTTQLGIYVAANSLALVFPLITSSLMNVFIQKSSSEKIDFLNQLLKNQKKYIPYLIGILIVTILITKPLFLVLFGEKYVESVDIFRILLIAYIGGIFFTPLESYFYSHSQQTILLIRFIQMIIIVLGIWVVLKFFGLESVAIIIVVSRVIGWIILYYFSIKYTSRSTYVE